VSIFPEWRIPAACSVNRILSSGSQLEAKCRLCPIIQILYLFDENPPRSGKRSFARSCHDPVRERAALEGTADG
jgi:hypothetical protein